MPLRRLRDEEEVARAAAAELADAACESLRERGRFSLALAGGGTPRRLYRQLAAAATVDWSRAELFFGDERAVGPEHPDSNYRMVRETLLEPAAIDARRVHRIEGERGDLDAAARDYEAELARVLGVEPGSAPPPLDLVLLGLGADGHTASLFPHSTALKECLRWVVANEVPGTGRRITMTFPLIVGARRLLVLVCGESKAAALAEVLEGPQDPERLPAQRLAQAQRVLWLVDAAAASRLGAQERRAP
jgi:6-phosphogluconolactonase